MDGYHREELLLIDEARPGSLDYLLVLQTLDEYDVSG
jgi:hypothetical protein